jgi:acyl-CoA thioesterase YciA
MPRKTITPTPHRDPVIRAVMLPRDTNHLGSIFGGHILSLIDLAAGQHARTIAPKRYVTKVVREVEFIAPVHVGDAVSFYAQTLKIGKTSITIRVDVEVLRGIDAVETIQVTSAEVVMVAVSDKMKPIPIGHR